MENGITLAIPYIVKKSITYREITIAIGIIVAMVVALTLWTRVPDEKSSGVSATVETNLPSALLEVLTTAAKVFSEETSAALNR